MVAIPRQRDVCASANIVRWIGREMFKKGIVSWRLTLDAMVHDMPGPEIERRRGRGSGPIVVVDDMTVSTAASWARFASRRAARRRRTPAKNGDFAEKFIAYSKRRSLKEIGWPGTVRSFRSNHSAKRLRTLRSDFTRISIWRFSVVKIGPSTPSVWRKLRWARLWRLCGGMPLEYICSNEVGLDVGAVSIARNCSSAVDRCPVGEKSRVTQ